jgi:apolipoprotein D and lipocalin family protein
MFRRLGALMSMLGSLGLGCATLRAAPLEATSRTVDLPRFMGDWYVLGFIPVDTFLISEADAHNAVESYRLQDDGSIATTYTFRPGSFTAPIKRMTPTGFVHDRATRAEWRMQFFWPFRSPYLIAHVDEGYEATVVGVPDRSHVWLMARRPDLPEEAYRGLVEVAERLGYDPRRIRRVPHQWTDREWAERGLLRPAGSGETR